MSMEKEAYVDTFMQTLAGNGVELNQRLMEIFSNVLQRQLEEDDSGNITPKANFETLVQIFTFVATPGTNEDRPVTPLAYGADRLQEAENAAMAAAGGDAQTISLDIGTFDGSEAEVVDAADGAFIFTDDASVESHVEITNFTTDDTIQISNLPAGDTYQFVANGNDVDITYNYNDEGTMNYIKLVGVGDVNDVYGDEAGFEAAIGFNAITYA